MHFIWNIAVCFCVCFIISESVRKNNFSVKSGKTINVSQTLMKTVLADSLIECACVCDAKSDFSLGVFKSNGGECLLYSANEVLNLDESTTDTVIVKWDGKDADECIFKPCENGGTCQDGVNGYSCTCSPGFTGDNCQTDNCVSDPCLNDGTCIDGSNMYSCVCKAGYLGTHCEIDINECDSSPCENNGACHDGPNTYSCTCLVGAVGNNCHRISVSKNKPAYQSTTFMTATPPYAFYGVDGDINTIFHTTHEVNPKWWVDLEQQYTVDLVVMRNRVDCCGERLANVTVYVGNDTNTDQMEKCAYFAGLGADAQVISLHCENRPTGNIVLLSMVNNEHYLHLAEVEVYPPDM